MTMPPPATAQEVYTDTVRAMPPGERLRLAALILEDFTKHNLSLVESSDAWSDQDQLDLAAFSLQYAATLGTDDEEPK